MIYFKAPIPKHTDGQIATYPPGWCGVMAQCPRDMIALLQNDEAGYLIASSDDIDGVKGCEARGEVEIVDEKTALATVEAADNTQEKIFKADKLLHRWDAKPELESEFELNTIVDGPGAAGAGTINKSYMKPKKQAMKTITFFCGACMAENKEAMSTMQVPQSFQGSGTIKVRCPNGHPVKAKMNQERGNG